jgi:hypothetical protein
MLRTVFTGVVAYKAMQAIDPRPILHVESTVAIDQLARTVELAPQLGKMVHVLDPRVHVRLGCTGFGRVFVRDVAVTCGDRRFATLAEALDAPPPMSGSTVLTRDRETWRDCATVRPTDDQVARREWHDQLMLRLDQLNVDVTYTTFDPDRIPFRWLERRLTRTCRVRPTAGAAQARE